MLHAMRIGHGYRVLEDEQLYQKCLKVRIKKTKLVKKKENALGYL